MTKDTSFLDLCEEFLTRYYRDEIGQLAQRYPKEQRSLVVDWEDLLRFNTDMADDYLEQPTQVTEYLTDALRRVDLPIDVGFEQAHVRVQNLNDERAYDVGGYLPQHIGQAVDVRGQVSQVSASKPELVVGIFECLNCGVDTEVPQAEGSDDLQQPNQCAGCERKGPFRLD